MSEEDIGEIRDELKEYKKQLDLMKEDLEIIVRVANPSLIQQVNQRGTGVPNVDPVLREKYRRFVGRYGHLV